MLYAIGDGGEVLTVAVTREHSDLVATWSSKGLLCSPMRAVMG
jgi:hypothetical protein